jgi:hypothetical protein
MKRGMGKMGTFELRKENRGKCARRNICLSLEEGKYNLQRVIRFFKDMIDPGLTREKLAPFVALLANRQRSATLRETALHVLADSISSER